jgi:hypothetical protein
MVEENSLCTFLFLKPIKYNEFYSISNTKGFWGFGVLGFRV